MIHPVIRIVSLLIFALHCARTGGAGLGIATLLLALSYLAARPAHWRGAWHMLRRMRWLLISLLVVYGWFTPGLVLWSGPGAPTVEGLAAGGVRAAALVLMVLAVHLLLETTGREPLLTAVLWLLRPVQRVGLSHERLAVRIVLVLRACGQVEAVVRAAVPSNPAPGALQRAGAAAALIWQHVMEKAEQEPCGSIVVPGTSVPPLWQWGVPLVLTALFAGAS